MNRKKWTLGAVCGVLALLILMGAASASGGQSDPLVTLSYLEQTVVPGILKQVEEKLDAKAVEVKEQALAEKTAFRTVEVKAGQQVTFTSGTQFLIRSGSFLSIDPLVDLTDGSTWDTWGDLPLNHLFLAVGDGQKISTSTSAVILVLGEYSVQ